MSETIEHLGYAKTDSRGEQYFFVRSTEHDQYVNLKNMVMFLHPFKTQDGKDKIRVIFRPANKIAQEPKAENL